jgi:hypothetical protein
MQMERILVEQIVPETFQREGSGLISFIPQYRNHLAENGKAHIFAASSLFDVQQQLADRRKEQAWIGPILHHELREHFFRIAHCEAVFSRVIANVYFQSLERLRQQFTMVFGRDNQYGVPDKKGGGYDST